VVSLISPCPAAGLAADELLVSVMAVASVSAADVAG